MAGIRHNVSIEAAVAGLDQGMVRGTKTYREGGSNGSEGLYVFTGRSRSAVKLATEQLLLAIACQQPARLSRCRNLLMDAAA